MASQGTIQEFVSLMGANMSTGQPFLSKRNLYGKLYAVKVPPALPNCRCVLIQYIDIDGIDADVGTRPTDVENFDLLARKKYDGVAARALFEKVDPLKYPRLSLIWSDNKYHSLALEAWLKEHRPGWTLEVRSPPEGSKGFVIVAKRWVVERTFAWIGRNRRLSKDYEKTISSSEATVQLANIALILRRPAPSKNPQRFHYRTKCENA